MHLFDPHHLRSLTLTGLLVLAFAGALGCQEPGESDEALQRRLEEQARLRPPRASMSLGYIHDLEGIDPGGQVELDIDEGTQIIVDEAYLVISAVEAHLCEPNRAQTGPEKGLLEPIEDLFVGEALAHVPSSATRLGTPFVEDLFAEGRARIVGEIAPPVGKYCRLYAIVSPADDDVVNLGELETADIVDKSLMLRGRWRPGPDAEWQTFQSASAARHAVELRAVDPNTGEHPLVFGKPSDSAMMLVDKTVSPALFEDLTPEMLDGPKAAEAVLERIENALHIRQFEQNN